LWYFGLVTEHVRFVPSARAVFIDIEKAARRAYPDYLIAQKVQEDVTRTVGHLAAGTELDFLMRHRTWVDTPKGPINNFTVWCRTPVGHLDSALGWVLLSDGTPCVIGIGFNVED
jgi:hypothetical protein